jgi:hypothetical protein
MTGATMRNRQWALKSTKHNDAEIAASAAIRLPDATSRQRLPAAGNETGAVK